MNRRDFLMCTTSAFAATFAANIASNIVINNLQELYKTNEPPPINLSGIGESHVVGHVELTIQPLVIEVSLEEFQLEQTV